MSLRTTNKSRALDHSVWLLQSPRSDLKTWNLSLKVITSIPGAAGYGFPLSELKDVTCRVDKVFIDLSESEVKTNFFEPWGNGSVLKNPEISGALYTLRIEYKYTQIQREDGARDFRVL